MAKKVRLIDACSLKDTLDAAMGTVGNHQSPEIKATAHILNGFGALVDSMPTVDAIPMDWMNWRIEHARKEGFQETARMLAMVCDWWEAQKALWQQEQGVHDGDS